MFLFAAALFNLVVQMSNIVTEKELRLRQVRPGSCASPTVLRLDPM